MKSTQKMSLYFWWTVLILGFLLLPQIFTLAAPMAINATNYHWENKTIPSGWFGGNANANQMDYTEGQVVPHWLGATGLATGTTYGFYIYYNYFRSGTVPDCGFDYLATWNTSLTPDKTPPGNTAGAPTPAVDGSFNGVGGSGSLYTSSNVTNVTIAGPFPDNTIPTANTSMYVRITFQINSGTSADFYYGLHLALDNSCYSPADGASGWSGASLQTRVLASSGGADATPPTATYFGSGASLQINPGAFKPAVVAGYKWYDLNGDGVWQLGPDNDPNTFDTGEEPTITGWTIQLWDCGADSTYTSCGASYQLQTLTDLTGFYTFPWINNTGPYYKVCEVLPSSYIRTYPAANCVNFNFTTTTFFQNFGNYLNADWGDLPETYGTLYPNGAAHILGNLQLGTLIDREGQGQPSTNADQDDLVLSDDEDGIFLSVFTEYSHNLTIDVTCSYSGTGVPWLLAWFDWNANNSFDAAETTFNTAVTCDGLPHSLTTDWSTFVEPDVRPESIYFRVRLFEGQPANPTLAFLGLAVNGEVEDYYWYGPTAATVSEPTAIAGSQAINIGWETFDEMDILGFRLYRSTDPSSQVRQLIYETPAVFRGRQRGSTYSFTDTNIQLGVSYTYWLDVLMKDGSTMTLDPITASVLLRIYLPTILR